MDECSDRIVGYWMSDRVTSEPIVALHNKIGLWSLVGSVVQDVSRQREAPALVHERVAPVHWHAATSADNAAIQSLICGCPRSACTASGGPTLRTAKTLVAARPRLACGT